MNSVEIRLDFMGYFVPKKAKLADRSGANNNLIRHGQTQRREEVFVRKGTLMQKIGELTAESKARLMINHKVQWVRNTANKLVEVFNSPQSRNYFMKVAWHLPEAQIWDVTEIALKKRVPVSYFIAATKQLLADQA